MCLYNSNSKEMQLVTKRCEAKSKKNLMIMHNEPQILYFSTNYEDNFG